MIPEIHTHCVARAMAFGEVTDSVSIVVDILRASTTIITALSNGARAVIPCKSIDEANTMALNFSGTLRGGERQGLPIPGFEYGNSPADYLERPLSQQSVAFTTTNGTGALLRCKEANRIFVGAFLNLSHLALHLRSFERPLHIVCAGTDGKGTGEDILFAGALTRRILDNVRSSPTLNRATVEALRSFDEDKNTPLVQRLQQTEGGRNLIQLGLKADIEFSSQIDSRPVLAEFLPRDNRIVRV